MFETFYVNDDIMKFLIIKDAEGQCVWLDMRAGTLRKYTPQGGIRKYLDKHYLYEFASLGDVPNNILEALK